MKIIILGASGLIGHQIYKYLKKYDNINILAISHKSKISECTQLVNLRDELSIVGVIKTFT